MGQSHVILTFDQPVVDGLALLVSRVGYFCPTPLRGKGLIPAGDYHLTAYYGFASAVCAASVQDWLDTRFHCHVGLRFTGLASHSVGGLRCWTVAVQSFGLLQLNHWLGQHDGALPSRFTTFRPHITLGYFQSGFDLGQYPPSADPFGPGGGLRGTVGVERIGCWFVDGATKERTRLVLPR